MSSTVRSSERERGRGVLYFVFYEKRLKRELQKGTLLPGSYCTHDFYSLYLPFFLSIVTFFSKVFR